MGQSPPEAEALLVFRHSMEAANLPTFLKIGNTKKSDICHLCKKSWVATKLGACALWPGPKTATRATFLHDLQ